MTRVVALPSVTAIIPTVLRDSLPRAIDSARAQIGVEVQVIVVVDLAEPRAHDLHLLRGADTVLFTGGRRNGSYARNMGVMAAKGEYVAFLDDDDEWLPEKTTSQLAAISGLPAGVASCSIIQPWNDGDSVVIPEVTIHAGQRVEDYLFSKRRPNIRRASLFTSTLLCGTALARSCLWNEGLSRHQDWEWLLQLQDKGAVVVQLPDPLVVIYPDSPGSISAKSDWESSLEWVKGYKNEWSKPSYSDFLASQVLRYSFQARSLLGVQRVTSELVAIRHIPSVPAMLTGCAGLLPKRSAMRLLSAIASVAVKVKLRPSLDGKSAHG